VARRWVLPPWLAWVLCWTSLALLVPAVVLRSAFPDGEDDGAFYAVVSSLAFVLVPLVGALIASRLPTNPYGWLWCALGLVFVVQAVLDPLRRTPVGLSWPTAVLAGAAFPVGLCLLLLVLLLFPTGRLPAPGWRWLARVAVLLTGAAVIASPFVPFPEDAADSSPWAVQGRGGELLVDLFGGYVTVMFLLLILASLSVLARFRRAGQVERQQLKWFLLAASLMAATTVLDLLRVPISEQVWAVLDAVTFSVLPVAVGVAVLRYRLYDIDRIISRTVSYGLLTAALIGLYLLVVALLRPLLEPLTGSSALAVAASTLAVAAVFDPARRRLQEAVDRRFDRARYDAAQAVDVFAARLRSEVDLDQVTAGLRDTVVTTVAPTRVAVWLRDVSSPREA
jgi:hypothetical protein